MEKYLIREVKKLEGNLLGLGINNDKIKDAIKTNNKILNCYLLEETPSVFKKNKIQLINKQKKINIKKITKTFKKKRIDNTICNFKTISPFLKTFIRDSIYMNKNNIYIYGTDEDYDLIIKRYKRYTKDIEVKKEKNSFLLIINTKNTKTSKIKDIGYWWKDTLENIVDALTALLVN